MTLRASLPDLDTLDSAALKALIFFQHEQLQSKDEQLLRKEEQLASREAEIEQLKMLIAKLRRMQFGRKSEKVERQIEQLQLRLDELEASRAEPNRTDHLFGCATSGVGETWCQQADAAAPTRTLATGDAQDSVNRHRGSGRPLSPATPPDMRVAHPAVQ
jgi:TolA-binding protein